MGAIANEETEVANGWLVATASEVVSTLATMDVGRATVAILEATVVSEDTDTEVQVLS